MRDRKVWGVLGLLLALVVVVGYGQQPLQPPSVQQFQEFWDLFQKHKDRCPKEGELREFWYTLLSVGGDSFAVFWDKDPGVPVGNDDAHTFGWFYKDIGGRALQPVLLGSYTRGIMSGLPHPDIPAYPGFGNQMSVPQPVHIYSPDPTRPLGAIGYFVNFAYHPGGRFRDIGGLYYSDKALNKDGKIHMKLLQIAPPKSYFILCWEDSYDYKIDQDFNDLFIGLFHYLR